MYDGPVVSKPDAAVISAPARTPSRLGSFFSGKGRNIGLFLALVIALLILAIFRPQYFRINNFIVVALQMAFIGIASLGMAHLIISGNVDLSIGGMFAICAVLSANLALVVPPVIALVAGTLLGGLIGLINGALVWRVRLRPSSSRSVP
jgi:ribose transport system permease protein